MNPTILDRVRNTRGVIKSGEVAERTDREPVGNRFPCLCGNENSILSTETDTVEIAGTLFYDGLKREGFL